MINPKAAAVFAHWAIAAADIANRVYVTSLLSDSSLPLKDVAIKKCEGCKKKVVIHKPLLELANKAKMIVCSKCVERAKGKSWRTTAYDQINRDSGMEI